MALPVRANTYWVAYGGGVDGGPSKSVNGTFTDLTTLNVPFTDFRMGLRAGPRAKDS